MLTEVILSFHGIFIVDRYQMNTIKLNFPLMTHPVLFPCCLQVITK